LYADARQKLTQGLFDAAIQEADRGYRDAARNDVVWQWKFRILQAEARMRAGDPRQAVELLAPDPPSDSPPDVWARRRIVQAEALCRSNRSTEAEAAIHDVEARMPDTRRDLQAQLAFTEARCASPRDRAAAMRYYRAAADLAHGVDSFVEASSLINLGLMLLQDQDPDKAIDQFRKTLRVTDSRFLKEKALGNLGFSYAQLGEMRRAIPFSEQAENLAAEIKNDSDQMKWLIDLGRERLHQLDYSGAEASFGRALALAQNLGDAEGKALCLHDLAQLALKTKDLAKAEEYIHRLQDLKPQGGHYLDLLLNQAELAKARKDFAAAEQFLNRLFEQMADQKGVDPATRWTAQSDLAGVYAAQGKFDSADRMFRAAVASAEATRSKIEGIEYRITFLDYSPFYDQYVGFLVSRKRILEAITIAEQGRSPTLSEGLSSNGRSPRIDIGRIQAVLKQQHQIVLAYWLGWEESYLWVITPTQIKLETLPAELEIEKEIEAYNREIIKGGTLESLQNRGQGLYKTLIGPAEPYLSKGSTVIIVPHRKLYNLAVETLVVPTPSPHYWIEDVRSQSVSFLNALTSARPRPAASKDLLVLGAPLLADKQFPVLQHALAEIQKASAHFPAARETVISGKDATPAAYLASSPSQFRYIHLVTHGTSSTVLENPLDAAIILSPVPGSAASPTDPEGSYRLYGKDIMKTPLQADLVIISACYGMGREYSGEGLVGLAWAFLRAGSHQVIAALWEVDDASMPQLMDDFYQEYTHGKSAAEALRDAKLRMLHSNDFHKRPYYWASLQLYTGS
jgi:CHAT domain-containing protein/Tfp pilus assembly protein PilF